MKFDDTIVALSTPYGVGGIAVIRISGSIAHHIITTLFSKSTLTPRYVHYGTLKNPSTGDNIDEVCVVYFKGPQSFTGDDVVEIQCHSSINIIKNCLKICCDLGARIADPGEFTKRAFLNGKMDLTKAESVIDLIHSKSDYANTIALNRLQGGLYKRIQTLRQTLMKELEQIEGAIDFPDEVEPPDRIQFQKTISETCHIVKHFLDYKDYGKYIQSGVKCLILGYPNVGKSSLLNQLLGEDRAIVTDTAGTTRDFIESTIEIGGLHFELIDTAGYRNADNKIEAMGISKIDDLLPDTNVILWVVDQTRELNTIEHKLAEKVKGHSHSYLLINKIDLGKNVLNTSDPLFENFQNIPVSAKTGDGIDTLKKVLHSDFVQKANDIDADLICNIRQTQCLNDVYTNLTDLLTNLNQQFEYDVLAIDLKHAILKLGEMTGEDITEEVLDGIFSRFCVGK